MTTSVDNSTILSNEQTTANIEPSNIEALLGSGKFAQVLTICHTAIVNGTDTSDIHYYKLLATHYCANSNQLVDNKTIVTDFALLDNMLSHASTEQYRQYLDLLRRLASSTLHVPTIHYYLQHCTPEDIGQYNKVVYQHALDTCSCELFDIYVGIADKSNPTALLLDTASFAKCLIDGGHFDNASTYVQQLLQQDSTNSYTILLDTMLKANGSQLTANMARYLVDPANYSTIDTILHCQYNKATIDMLLDSMVFSVAVSNIDIQHSMTVFDKIFGVVLANKWSSNNCYIHAYTDQLLQCGYYQYANKYARQCIQLGILADNTASTLLLCQCLLPNIRTMLLYRIDVTSYSAFAEACALDKRVSTLVGKQTQLRNSTLLHYDTNKLPLGVLDDQHLLSYTDTQLSDTLLLLEEDYQSQLQHIAGIGKAYAEHVDSLNKTMADKQDNIDNFYSKDKDKIGLIAIIVLSVMGMIACVLIGVTLDILDFLAWWIGVLVCTTVWSFTAAILALIYKFARKLIKTRHDKHYIKSCPQLMYGVLQQYNKNISKYVRQQCLLSEEKFYIH